jgi:LPS export ABC transporter protein LptC
VIKRRKKIILIQLVIFIVAAFLLYNTYRDKNKVTEEIAEIKTETNPDTNSFVDVEYSGFDLNGNRYTLNAGKADFETKTPEIINMKNVVANFYLKDGTLLRIISDDGLYNNKTLDMIFIDNVKTTYLSSILISNQLDYSNTNGKLLASGNVRGESVEKGTFFADNVEYDLTNKTLEFSMLGNKKVNVKVKD